MRSVRARKKRALILYFPNVQEYRLLPTIRHIPISLCVFMAVLPTFVLTCILVLRLLFLGKHWKWLYILRPQPKKAQPQCTFGKKAEQPSGIPPPECTHVLQWQLK